MVEIRKPLVLIIIFTGFLFFKKEVYSANLLVNPSFEEGNLFWQTNNKNVNFTIISGDASDGTQSALIENSNVNYSYGIEQTIKNIKKNFSYRIASSIRLQNDQTKAFFRIAWYESNDGSGSQFSIYDSDSVSSYQEWQKIEIIRESPDNISSAKIRLLVKNGSAYFDDIIFEEYISSTPTPTIFLSPSPTITTIPTIPTVTLISTPVLISYDNIYLSEVMVDPVNNEKEWVEIYNDNDFLVELNNWFVDDLENGGSTPKSFNMVLDKKSYGVIEFSSAIFNNSGDQVRLLDFNKLEKDSFEYLSSEPGKTYGRISFSSDEWCLQEPTKGKENSSCLTMSTTNSSLTSSFTSQPTKLLPSPSNKSSNFISYSQTQSRYSGKKIYKSYQPRLESLEKEKNSLSGQVLGEETKKTNKKNNLIFLSLFYSISSNFFFLRKILKQIPWQS